MKCPYSFKSCDDIEKYSALEEKDGKVTLKKNHVHYYQLQFQMYCCNVFKADYVLWSPKGVFIETVDFDLSFVEEKLIICKAFFFKVIFY